MEACTAIRWWPDRQEPATTARTGRPRRARYRRRPRTSAALERAFASGRPLWSACSPTQAWLIHADPSLATSSRTCTVSHELRPVVGGLTHPRGRRHSRPPLVPRPPALNRPAEQPILAMASSTERTGPLLADVTLRQNTTRKLPVCPARSCVRRQACKPRDLPESADILVSRLPGGSHERRDEAATSLMVAWRVAHARRGMRSRWPPVRAKPQGDRGRRLCAGRPAFNVVTISDYLARRDAGGWRPAGRDGLTVGWIAPRTRP